jgi:hypothetical protein
MVTWRTGEMVKIYIYLICHIYRLFFFFPKIKNLYFETLVQLGVKQKDKEKYFDVIFFLISMDF